MASIFDDIRAASPAVDNGMPMRGGGRPGNAGQLMQFLSSAQTVPWTQADYAAGANNPNSVSGAWTGTADPIWGGLPGAERFYQPGVGADGSPSLDRDAMWRFLQDNGMSWQVGQRGDETVNYIQGPNGPIAETANFTRAEDDRFKLAALAAGAVVGGAAAGVGSGTAASGAQTFPVAAQAADVTTQLGALGAGGGAGAAGAGGAAGVNLGMGGAGAATAGDFGVMAGANGAATYGSVGAAEAAGAVASAGGGGAAFDWSSLFSSKGVRSGIDLLSGLYGMKLAGDAREASDPFAQYRPGYGQQLAQLEANPNLITQRPGWLAGTELIGRTMASRGYTGSGNEKAALSRYAGDFYTQEANRLATLAGAGQTPGAGQFASAQLASQSLGSIGYGIAPWLPPKS